MIMKNKKIMAVALVIASVAATSMTYAASTNSWTTLNKQTRQEFKGWMQKGWKIGINKLTTEEQTALEKMTDVEKKAFFDKKMTEQKTKMDSHKVVLDKLINGETLTADEQKVLAEIKTTRSLMEKKRGEMDAMKVILDKQRAWTTLTADEQAKLDAFKATNPMFGEWMWKMQKNGNWERNGQWKGQGKWHWNGQGQGRWDCTLTND